MPCLLTCSLLLPAAYTQLKPLQGQWDISIAATKTDDKTVFVPQVCNATALSAPCIQPLLSADNNDKLKVGYALKGDLRTFDNLPPVNLIFSACYSPASTVSRAWRAVNDEFWVSPSCGTCWYTTPHMPFTSSSSCCHGGVLAAVLSYRTLVHYLPLCLPAKGPSIFKLVAMPAFDWGLSSVDRRWVLYAVF